MTDPTHTIYYIEDVLSDAAIFERWLRKPGDVTLEEFSQHEVAQWTMMDNCYGGEGFNGCGRTWEYRWRDESLRLGHR